MPEKIEPGFATQKNYRVWADDGNGFYVFGSEYLLKIKSRHYTALFMVSKINNPFCNSPRI